MSIYVICAPDASRTFPGGIAKEVTGDALGGPIRGLHVISYDAAHAQAHQGNLYTLGRLVEAVADDGTIDILIQVGDSSLHSTGSGASTGDSIVSIFEGTTFSAAGTAVTAYNHNRISSNVTTATFTHTPTITADGTELSATLIPGGTGGNAIGGSDGGPVRSGGEWILASNTDYLIRIKNIAGTAQNLNIQLSFYEV